MSAVIERLPDATGGKGGRRGRLTVDDLQRLVAATGETMEPIVSDYFHRLQDLLSALRHTTALLTLLGSQSPAGGAAEGQDARRTRWVVRSRARCAICAPAPVPWLIRWSPPT